MKVTKERNIIVFDLETTGFNAPVDEVLQVSIARIRSDGSTEPLLNSYVKPEHTSSWERAMKINNITPDMVKDAPTLKQLAPAIEKIFSGADMIVSYNGRKTELGEPWAGFDRPFLEKCGVSTGDAPDYDVMVEFKKLTKMPCYSKLTYTSQIIGYDFSKKAHDSMEDVKATAICYNFFSSGRSIGEDKLIGLILDYKRDEAGNIRQDRNGNKLLGYNGEFKILTKGEEDNYIQENNGIVMILNDKLGFESSALNGRIVRSHEDEQSIS